MNPQDPLAALHPLRTPEPIGWWPLAPGWWVLLMFVPLVNIVINAILSIAIGENFGKGTGFGIGLFILPIIFYPILGFGEATYRGR